jgi:hypothetical protein
VRAPSDDILAQHADEARDHRPLALLGGLQNGELILGKMPFYRDTYEFAQIAFTVVWNSVPNPRSQEVWRISAKRERNRRFAKRRSQQLWLENSQFCAIPGAEAGNGE